MAPPGSPPSWSGCPAGRLVGSWPDLVDDDHRLADVSLGRTYGDVLLVDDPAVVALGVGEQASGEERRTRRRERIPDDVLKVAVADLQIGIVDRVVDGIAVQGVGADRES